MAYEIKLRYVAPQKPYPQKQILPFSQKLF